MAFTKLQFRPGVDRESTNYSSEGGWFDCNRIRFRKGFPETIGGWVKFANTTALGTCRALRGWRALDGSLLLGVGTNLKYYINRGGAYYDITPIRLVTAPGDVTFTAADGSATIVVTHTLHGAQPGDFVTFSEAVSLGGAITADVLNKEFQIQTVPTTSTYTIVVPTTATAADTGNGGSITVGRYQITTGYTSTPVGAGWGAGPWGGGGWGEAATSVSAGADARVWSHATYGEDLVYAPRGGGVYYWDRSLGLTQRGVELASLPGSQRAPTMANVVVLSDRDRHLLVFGTDDEFSPGIMDPLLIRFSSQESLTEWRSLPTTTAGSLRIGSGSEIVAAVPTKQMTVVLTDIGVHTIQYIGPPFTFGMTEVATGTTVAGPNAAVSVGDEVYWMGQGEFYRFNGLVQQVPCAVKSYVFDNINASQYLKVFGGHNSAHGEVWWFYPDASSSENNRYVVYNYLQNIWYYGEMARTAWADRGAFSLPIAITSDGQLYYHESGVADGEHNPPTALGAFIESSPVDIGEGDRFMFIRRMIPDVTFPRSTGEVAPTARMTIKMRNTPGGSYVGENERTITQVATVPVEEFTEQVYLRLRGRSAIFRIETLCRCTAWHLGTPRIDVRTDGGRA